MLSPHACEKVYSWDKLGNPNSVEPPGAGRHTYQQWVVHCGLTDFSAASGYPQEVLDTYFSVAQRESRKEGRVVRIRTMGAEHNAGQCSAFSIPFYWGG